MKIDLDTVLCDLKGVPLKETPEKDFTLGAACCTALLNPFSDEQNLDPKEKFNRYKLAQKISDGGERDLSVEDVATLKKLIGKAFPPLVVGRCYDILDPESPKIKVVS